MKNKNHFLSCFMCMLTVLAIGTDLFAQVVPNNPDNIAPVMLADDVSEEQVRTQMQLEGMPDATIDVLIKQRKEMFASGLKVERMSLNRHTIINSLAKKKNTPQPYGVCSDMGGENGWGSWQAEIGGYGAGGPLTSSGGPLNGVLTLTAIPTPISPRFSLTSAGVDPCTPGTSPGAQPVPLVCPGFGSHSISLGEPRMNGKIGGCSVPMYPPYNNGCAEQLTYVLNVTPADTNFMWAVAFFIDEPDQNSNAHVAGNTPYAGMCIYDTTGAPIPCGCFKFDQGCAVNGYTQGVCSSQANPPGIVWYKPWAVSGVNLSKYIGQSLTIVLTNVDCAWGGHFAYSYWDFMCQPPTTPVSFCPGQTISLCASIPIPGNPYTYQWYKNGILYPGGTSQCISPIPQQGDTFTVDVMQPSGCNFKLLFTVQMNSITPGFTYTGQCGQMTFTDQSSSSNSVVPVSTWNWSFPGGNPASSSSQAPGTIHYPPGTYTVTLIVSTASGCPDTIKKVITVGGFPTAAFQPTAPCLGGNTQLHDGSVSNQGDPIVSWNWQMNGGNPASSASQNTSTIYNSAGTHSVTLVVTTQQGCVDTIIQQVLVYKPPVANFSGPIKGCAPVCNNYSDLSTSTDGTITNWVWSFPGGSSASSTSQNPQNICYNTPGNYSASLIITSSYGCKDTIKLPVVEVYPWPKADFCVSPFVQPTLDPVFNFCDQWSPDVVKWEWNFGDNDTDNFSTDPVHSYSATANQNDFYSYNICIRVQNIHGCWDTTCHTVELVPEFEFYIPNTFTPNGDFMNETFFGKCRGVKDYNIMVFDRWGNLLWECHHSDKNTNWDGQGQDGLSSFCKWDGKVVGGGMDMNGQSNELAQEDVYVWKVELTDIFDKHHSYIGHVNIVK